MTGDPDHTFEQLVMHRCGHLRLATVFVPARFAHETPGSLRARADDMGAHHYCDDCDAGRTQPLPVGKEEPDTGGPYLRSNFSLAR